MSRSFLGATTRLRARAGAVELDIGLAAVLLLILGAEFVNGWTDCPNAIATVVSTRVLPPRIAIAVGALARSADRPRAGVAFALGYQDRRLFHVGELPSKIVIP